MASGTRGTNTMMEGLRSMMALISELKITPDADLEFLINLETTILQKVRGQVDSAAGQMEGVSEQFQGGIPGAAPASPAGMGAPGTPGNFQMGNPDEMRRMLTGR
jgi:hypothetical protein